MIIQTPFGTAWAAIGPVGALEAFGFGHPPVTANPHSPAVARQIAEYCQGIRTSFELDLNPRGSEFQKRVWAELVKIPYGQTITYAELAQRVGATGAARAVGRANATNPIALVVPCHRVIGVNGSLTGYAYGIELKRRLLDWEMERAV